MMTISFIGLTLFLTFIFFEPGIVFPVLGEIRAALIISVITLITAVLAGAKPPRALHNRLFLVLLFLGVISLLVSPIPANEMNRSHLTHLYKAVALYFLVAMIIASKEYLIRFFYMTLGFASIVSIVSILTVRAGIESLKGGDLYRMVNYFGGVGDDSNQFGAIMLAFFPIPLGLMQAERSMVKKAVYFIITLSFFLCVIRTRSRGAFLGLLVVLVILAWEHRKNLKIMIVLSLIIGYAFFHTHHGYWDRISTLTSETRIEHEHSAYSRIMQNQWAIELIKKYPFTGVGLGNFIQAKIEILGLDPAQKYTKYVPHNSYLGIGAELGVLGLFAFAMIILASLHYASTAAAYFESREDFRIFGVMSRSIRTGLAGLSVCIFFLSEEFNLVLYLFIAFTVALRSLMEQERAHAIDQVGPGDS